MKSVAWQKPVFERSELVLAETDGSMVPIVEYSKNCGDKRKNKTVLWKELRVGAMQRKGSVRRLYAASFSTDSLLRQMKQTFRLLGANEEAQVHAVGDGASRVKELLYGISSNSSFLIDIFHLFEYLAEASEICGSDKGAHAMDPHHAGVRACLQYIQNRVEQFNYKEALANDLPIGSGKIESTNRSLVQARVKLPGA